MRIVTQMEPIPCGTVCRIGAFQAKSDSLSIGEPHTLPVHLDRAKMCCIDFPSMEFTYIRLELQHEPAKTPQVHGPYRQRSLASPHLGDLMEECGRGVLVLVNPPSPKY
jgi:hypothetical protein